MHMHMHAAGPPTAAARALHAYCMPPQCVYCVCLYLPWQALGLTASVTCALTVYALRSKRDFSFMGAGCDREM